jgi:hypothetical protein
MMHGSTNIMICNSSLHIRVTLCVTACSLVDGIDVSVEKKKSAAFIFSTQKAAKNFVTTKFYEDTTRKTVDRLCATCEKLIY